ncbi:uncharacterized protein GWK60_L12001 [Nakaseomyces glabratus]|nr:DASH complex subunit Spc34 [Nakaseomyces glabratus]QNG16477.1 uncharacterized protein GWK60_L12001 [Nakaseomyces glabratus]
MGESMNSCLEEINGCLDSITSLYFKPPGIFHNAMIRISKDGKETHTLNDKIKNLIKGCDTKEETTLFQLDPVTKSLRRKDGRQALFDYLDKRDLNMKRNRRLGHKDEKPVIHVPNEFYIREHDEELLRDSQRTKRFKAAGHGNDVDSNNTNNTTTALITELFNDDVGLMATMRKKFKDNDEIKNLLMALQKGSVILDEKEGISTNNRRRTLFVEDFSTESILKLLDAVLEMFPTEEYKKAAEQYHDVFQELNEESEKLLAEIQLQKDEIEGRLKIESSKDSTTGVQKLIEKERQKIAELESQLRISN